MTGIRQQPAIVIGDRRIGVGQPVYVIAEAGVNHNGDIELARQLIDIAADAGADAVKFQTFKAELLATREAPKASYQLQTTDAAESQYEMLRSLELTEDVHRELFDYCRARQIQFLSAPFDEASADFLETLGVAAYKIPSGELTNLPLLAHVARKGKAMIVSTGMATLEEVEIAVGAILRAGNDQFSLLHCVSNYPADPAEVNLRAMLTMQEVFKVPVGFSDHTRGIEVALAAVALGASLIEKHFTLDRTLPGPDHQVSLEPDELARMVQGIRKVTSALGDGRKKPAPSEVGTAAVARKSLVAARHILRGTVLTEELIQLRRPGTGLPASMRESVLGRRALQDIESGALISQEVLD